MSQRAHITFRYSLAPGYRKVPMSGVWGGAMPDGSIIANFFVDAPEIPQSVTYEMTADHVLGEEIGRERASEGPVFERSLEVGVVMSPDRARALAQWLLAKAEELDRARLPECDE